MADIKVVCGWGNPGERYEHTRHNLGYDIVDRLATDSGPASRDCTGLFTHRALPGAAGTVQVIKSLTHVNRSGAAIRAALDRFGAGPEELFVISDYFHLSLGTIRVRKSGSSGGHNGLQSVIDEIGVADFARLRVGIGPPPDDTDVITNFVLSRFDPGEEEIVAVAKSRAVDAVRMVIRGEIDLAISSYNSSNPTPET